MNDHWVFHLPTVNPYNKSEKTTSVLHYAKQINSVDLYNALQYIRSAKEHNKFVKYNKTVYTVLPL